MLALGIPIDVDRDMQLTPTGANQIDFRQLAMRMRPTNNERPDSLTTTLPIPSMARAAREAGLQRIDRQETEDYLRKPLGSRGVERMVEQGIQSGVSGYYRTLTHGRV